MATSRPRSRKQACPSQERSTPESTNPQPGSFLLLKVDWYNRFPQMNLLRALVLLFALSSGLLGGGVLDSHVSTSAAASPNAPAAEDASTQGKAVAEAYNLLLDHYVHPPDTAALLKAGLDHLVTEADGKAAAPGPAPAFDGDRAADLETMRTALAAYLDKPNSEPDNFVAAHALMRAMGRLIH